MKFRALIRAGSRSLVPWLYPALCELCGRWAPCESHTLVVCEEPRCNRCAQLLPEGVAWGQSCGDCALSSSGLAQVLALGSYGEGAALKPWVMAFKHGSRPDLSQPLGACLGERLTRLGALDPASLLVPVPLHFWRRMQRGYDQAALLAQAVSRGADRPWVPALYRARPTAAQGSLYSRGRASNVHGAFGLHPEHAAKLQNQDVYLVDDVFTSGATLRACARVLRRAGVRRVGALVLARAERFA
ncbi:MAG: ComF family protein [Planctomycetota bacterium]|jgi:ComF family protein